MKRPDQNHIIIRAYPIKGWDTTPCWLPDADRWAYSISFKDYAGPSMGGYKNFKGAIKAGETFLRRINTITEMRKEVMYASGNTIVTKDLT